MAIPLPHTSSGSPHRCAISVIDIVAFNFRKSANSRDVFGEFGNISSRAEFCPPVTAIYAGSLQSRLSDLGRHTFAVKPAISDSSVILVLLNCPLDEL